jgi:hypothetical protein
MIGGEGVWIGGMLYVVDEEGEGKEGEEEGMGFLRVPPFR